MDGMNAAVRSGKTLQYHYPSTLHPLLNTTCETHKPCTLHTHAPAPPRPPHTGGTHGAQNAVAGEAGVRVAEGGPVALSPQTAAKPAEQAEERK